MRILALCALAFVVVGCKSSKEPPVALLDPAVIELSEPVLRTGSIGLGKWQSEATYALVEAANTTDRDAMVTIGGSLIDNSGQVVADVRRESLRIPAGGSRVFAMVDDDGRARPEATSARPVVTSAFHAEHPARIVVTDGTVFDDHGRAVVGGYVVNQAETQAAAIVMAAFFDAEGRPMSRPSTMFQLDPGLRRGMQLVGPEGSKSALLYIGEVVY